MSAQATALSAFSLVAFFTLGAASAQAKGTPTMKYDVQVQEVAAQPALVVKGKVSIEKAGDAIGGSIGAVGAYLEQAKLQPAGAPFTRTYSFENGVLEFESGFPVASTPKGKGTVIATELPRATVATTVHIGSQETSENAYGAIHAWMKANAKQPAGAPWEVYVDETKMQIFFPIR
jgi:effector-binding domain-containing protein